MTKKVGFEFSLNYLCCFVSTTRSMSTQEVIAINSENSSKPTKKHNVKNSCFVMVEQLPVE